MVAAVTKNPPYATAVAAVGRRTRFTLMTRVELPRLEREWEKGGRHAQRDRERERERKECEAEVHRDREREIQTGTRGHRHKHHKARM